MQGAVHGSYYPARGQSLHSTTHGKVCLSDSPLPVIQSLRNNLICGCWSGSRGFGAEMVCLIEYQVGKTGDKRMVTAIAFHIFCDHDWISNRQEMARGIRIKMMLPERTKHMR
jgi:hypothetical protein